MTWSSIACGLLLALSAASSVQSQKPSGNQAKMLDSARAFALQYTTNLPNFICTQTTHRRVADLSGFTGGMTGVSTGGRSVLGMPTGISSAGNDTIEEHVSFYDRSEHYEVFAVNGEKVSGLDHLQFAGALSAGEFGSALENIFDPGSGTTFSWQHDSSVKGRRVHVLRFHVPKEHGNLVIYRRGDRQILAPYSGRVVIDAENEQVIKIASDIELPAGFPIKMASTTVEYRPVEIAGDTFNLPYESEVRLEDGMHLYVNEIEFRKYHKFAVQSTIHYDSNAQSPPQ